MSRIKHPSSFPLQPFPIGTQVVVLSDVAGSNNQTLHPRGAVGIVVKSPADVTHAYMVKFPDGYEKSLKSGDLTTLSKFKAGDIHGDAVALKRDDLFDHVIFQCVIGSQAYGLTDEESDVDRRGFFLPPADQHWSLAGVPEQIDCHETQEAYWEIQKFLVLALKANPNVLECLYSPIVEKATPLTQELLDMRSIFLTRMIYQTFNGYVMSQFKKMQADVRNKGKVKPKHVMHLIRLLLSGIGALRDGVISVEVTEHREELLAIKRSEMPLDECEKWRLSLHKEFEAAFAATTLPERPDYERADAFLLKARRSMAK